MEPSQDYFIGKLEGKIEGLNHTLQVQNLVIKELSSKVDTLQEEVHAMQKASVKSSGFMAGAMFVATSLGSLITYVFHYFQGN